MKVNIDKAWRPLTITLETEREFETLFWSIHDRWNFTRRNSEKDDPIFEMYSRTKAIMEGLLGREIQ